VGNRPEEQSVDGVAEGSDETEAGAAAVDDAEVAEALAEFGSRGRTDRRDLCGWCGLSSAHGPDRLVRHEDICSSCVELFSDCATG